MKRIRHNEYFRQKVKELYSRLLQANNMVPNHNLYYGLLAESILRDFLRDVLPMRVGICQGFIEQDGQVSQQCDIIIYDQLNYASIYSYGEIQVIPSDSVIVVIEVKTSINANSFHNTLEAFKSLAQMGITNKYIFIFHGPTVKTLEKYFYPKETGNDDVYIGEPLYDHSDIDRLPKAILNLKRNYYLKQDLVPDVDMMGYMAYKTVDNGGANIVCLQSFIESILSLIIPLKEEDNALSVNKSAKEEDDNEDFLNDMKVIDGFGLFRI